MSTVVEDLAAWLTQIWDEDEARLSAPTFCGPVWPTTDQMLARIAADRKILELHEGLPVWPDDELHCRECSPDHSRYPCRTIRLLGSANADRPGYQEHWLP